MLMLVASPSATGFIQFGSLADLHLCNEAETGSLALRLARSLGGASTGRIAPLAARFATC
jgi:hypothetical protein